VDETIWLFWDEPKPFNLNQTKHWGRFFFFSFHLPALPWIFFKNPPAFPSFSFFSFIIIYLFLLLFHRCYSFFFIKFFLFFLLLFFK
jgi:hypothetical protein